MVKRPLSRFPLSTPLAATVFIPQPGYEVKKSAGHQGLSVDTLTSSLGPLVRLEMAKTSTANTKISNKKLIFCNYFIKYLCLATFVSYSAIRTLKPIFRHPSQHARTNLSAAVLNFWLTQNLRTKARSHFHHLSLWLLLYQDHSPAIKAN